MKSYQAKETNSKRKWQKLKFCFDENVTEKKKIKNHIE